jgi:hypothetical protein
MSFSLDRRRSPILTVRNALQGLIVQGVPITTIREARKLFSDSELRQFALDRAPTITTLTASGTVPISEKLQLTSDVTFIRVSDTDSSFNPIIDGGIIAGSSGTGVDMLYNLQFIGNSVIKAGDIGIFGLSFSDFNISNVYGLNLNIRYPVSQTVRFNPRFDFIYRANDRDSGERFRVRPEVRFEYRPWRRGRIEADFGGEWLKDRRTTETNITRLFTMNIGYRVDF